MKPFHTSHIATFKKRCDTHWVGLHDPWGSLPVQDILLLSDSTKENSAPLQHLKQVPITFCWFKHIPLYEDITESHLAIIRSQREVMKIILLQAKQLLWIWVFFFPVVPFDPNFNMNYNILQVRGQKSTAKLWKKSSFGERGVHSFTLRPSKLYLIIT